MRNGIQQPQLQPSQQQLNESIDRTRALMQQMRGMGNQEVLIANLLQTNPQLKAIVPLLRNGNSLEGIAKTMAMNGGYDLNQIINQLSGGIH